MEAALKDNPCRVIWQMEREFWLGGVDAFRKGMAGNAVVVLPSPYGLLCGHQIVEAIAEAPRWLSVDFDEVVQTSRDGTFCIAYRATGCRQGEPAYHVWCSSTYSRVHGDWRLMLHQQARVGC